MFMIKCQDEDNNCSAKSSVIVLEKGSVFSHHEEPNFCGLCAFCNPIKGSAEMVN